MRCAHLSVSPEMLRVCTNRAERSYCGKFRIVNRFTLLIKQPDQLLQPSGGQLPTQKAVTHGFQLFQHAFGAQHGSLFGRIQCITTLLKRKQRIQRTDGPGASNAARSDGITRRGSGSEGSDGRGRGRRGRVKRGQGSRRQAKLCAECKEHRAGDLGTRNLVWEQIVG